MSFKRIMAVAGVFLLACAGWGVLSATVFYRTRPTGPPSSPPRRRRLLWAAAMTY